MMTGIVCPCPSSARFLPRRSGAGEPHARLHILHLEHIGALTLPIAIWRAGQYTGFIGRLLNTGGHDDPSPARSLAPAHVGRTTMVGTCQPLAERSRSPRAAREG